MASKLGWKRQGSVSIISGIRKTESLDGVVLEVAADDPVYGRVRVVFSRENGGLSVSVNVKSQAATTIAGPTPMDTETSEFFLAQLGALLDGAS